MTKRTLRPHARVALGVVLMAMVAGGCRNKVGDSASERAGAMWATGVTSPAVKEHDTIPAKYTADGGNVSPPLNWTRVFRQTREFAVIVEDVDAKGRTTATHWIVYGIPASVTRLPENAAASMQYKQGQNYLGETGYAGPAATDGKTHRYFFQVFALAQPLDLPEGATKEQLLAAFGNTVASKGRLVANYTAPGAK